MPPKPAAKKSAGKKPAPKGLTKAQVMSEIATKTGQSKALITEIFHALCALIEGELHGGRPVTVPGLAKITLVRQPAKPARPGVNPFTGQSTIFPAKPARNVVKVRAIKALKDMAPPA